MRSLLRFLRQFLSELRRRNVYRVALAYLAAGFVAVELADIAAGTFDLPGWFGPMVWVVVGIGFPIALVMAWALEMTPEGVRVEEPEGSEEGAAAPTSSLRDLWIGASVLALLLVGAWWMWGSLGEGEANDQAERRALEIQDRSIAVLPFEVSGAGAEEWRDGMVTMLSMNLDRAAGLRAIADRRIFAAAQEVDSMGIGAGQSPSLTIAKRTGAKYAVVGSAVQLGEELRLGAEVRDVTSGRLLDEVQVEGRPGTITALTDRLTRKVLGVLLEKSEEQIPSVDLASITTSSLEALTSFLDGERRLRAGDFERAVTDFKAAIRRDSSFALAYSRLAFAHWGAANPKKLVARNWHRARERSEKLPSRARRLVRAVDLWFNRGQDLSAADSLRTLAETYPDDPSIWYYLGEVVLHSSIPGGYPEADRAFDRAVELDPGHAFYYAHLLHLAFMFHRDRALAARRIAALPEMGGETFAQLAHDLVFAGSAEKRRQVLARLDTMSIEPELVPLAGAMFVGATLHPTDGALQERVLRTLIGWEDKGSGEYRTAYPRLLVGNGLEQGRVAQAIADLPKLSDSTMATCLLARSSSLGTPVPDSVADNYLDPSALGEDVPPGRLACAGVYLADQGRSGALDALLGRLRQRATRRQERSDVSEASVRAMITELESYRAWKRGALGSATSLPPRAIFIQRVGWWPLTWGGIWRGDLYRARGELQKAEGWYLGTWWHPVAHERLGQLYEQMDKPEKAQAAYERFVTAWEDADPALQDRVETARERLDALPDSLFNVTAKTE